MAVCDDCKREMTTSDGCSISKMIIGTKAFHRIRVFEVNGALSNLRDGKLRCHDCGALPDRFHHPGCDMELCPRCGNQAISCGC